VAFCFERRDGAKTAADERFARRPIAAEPLVLVAAPGQGSAEHSLAALATLSFVATEPGCIYRHMFDMAFAEAGVTAPKLATEVGSIGAIARLVAAGAGLGFVPPALRQLLTAARDTLVPVPPLGRAGSELESANRSKALFANNS
ncbi:LysR family transcriptional regulator substrate-binding protein, partial [Mesorhizobium sp.]|uniref:LysR family transcriptional regulator substrate-binding protein n=1 Tax=Mesorhizobium sp. TaxID=1871066 RepID=UPI001211AE22